MESMEPISDEIDIHAEASAGPLLLPGRKFPLNFSNGEFRVRGRPIVIEEVANSGLGTGLTIWDGSVVLAKYLEHAGARLGLPGAVALELGAGTGVVGIAAAAAGAQRVVLTDLQYTLDNMLHNVRLNAASLEGSVEARELDWFKPQVPPLLTRVDLVLAADVVWVSPLIAPLVRAMRHVCSQFSPPPVVLVAHQTRSRAGDHEFFLALEDAGFDVSEVPREEHHPAFRDDDIRIFRMVWQGAQRQGAGTNHAARLRVDVEAATKADGACTAADRPLPLGSPTAATEDVFDR